jgi:sarcosine oxidase subunit beta
MAGYDAVIIGGGNLGLWTAYHLARRGLRRIAVLERSWLGNGATTRSAGVVRQQGGSETAVRLGAWSRELYLQLGTEVGLDSGFTRTGYYVLAETPDEKDAFQSLVELRRRCGVENEWVDPAEGRRRFPALRWEHFLGATYNAADGYVHPPIVVRNITIAVLRTGIEAVEQCPVEAVDASGSHYRVRTPRGTFETDRLIDAAGPRGARRVAAMVGVEHPVGAVRHEIVTFPALDGVAGVFPMFFVPGKGYYVRPEEHGALLGASNPRDQADGSEGFQIAFDWEYLNQIRPQVDAIFPAIAGVPISRAWAASIDYTPDHLPIIDQPRPGFYVLAAGGHGMMWGPALGMKMAELVETGAVRDLPADEIRLGRFAEGKPAKDLIALPFPDVVPAGSA